MINVDERTYDLEGVANEDVEEQNKHKYFIFSIGSEQYGIEILNVIEIIGIQQITQIPGIPSYVKGIVNIRGKIVPVIDVRLRFQMEPLLYNDRTCIVVIEVDHILLGLIVDSISEVLFIPPENIMVPIKKNNQDKAKHRYVHSIARLGQEVKLLIDCKKLILDETL